MLQFIANLLGLNLFVVINKTMSYSSPGDGKRDYVPVGTVVEIIKRDGIWAQISGKDPNPWKGKWVNSQDLEPYVETVPEEPPAGNGPDTLEIDAGALRAIAKDEYGTVIDEYTNPDVIVLTKVA